jgi:DHA2 family multidrug resistance protein
VIFAAVSFWTVHFDTDVTLKQLFIPRLIYGAGMPLFFVPLMSMALAGLPPQKVASASGLLNFMRMLGAGFGASLGISLWDNRQALHDARISESISASGLGGLVTPGLDAVQRSAELAQAVMRQSFMQATDDFAWISGWIFALLILLVWAARRPKAAAGAATVVDAGH